MIHVGLTRAAENYLVTIYVLQKDKMQLRSIDVVNALNYSRPTVSIALRKLRENHHVTMDDRGFITLTTQGKKLAQRVYKRRTALRDLLVHKGVSEETAERDAALIEHDLSDESFKAIVSNQS